MSQSWTTINPAAIPGTVFTSNRSNSQSVLFIPRLDGNTERMLRQGANHRELERGPLSPRVPRISSRGLSAPRSGQWLVALRIARSRKRRYNSPMRVLIVGCGYVGVALGVELVKQGHEVFGQRRSAAGETELKDVGIHPLIADVTQP